jgi:hypothetical protein
MTRIKTIRNLSFVLLVVSLFAWRADAAQLGHQCNDPGLNQVTYTGGEVECMGSYPGNACDAFCDLCFGTECVDVNSCELGVKIVMTCVPPPVSPLASAE